MGCNPVEVQILSAAPRASRPDIRRFEELPVGAMRQYREEMAGRACQPEYGTVQRYVRLAMEAGRQPPL